MIDRSCLIRRMIAGLCLMCGTGCSHRQGTVAASPITKTVAPQMLSVVAPVPSRTFAGPGIQFDYPGDWQPAKGQTALFAITSPAGAGSPSLNLDVPKLPWHLPGMISAGMVASGYISDLKKNQIPDAVVDEECPVTVCGETAKRVTCCGHIDGKPSTDVAVIIVHDDHVYILSADSDEAGCDCARKTIDQAVKTWKWTK